MNNTELFLAIYNLIALSENRLKDQNDDLFNVSYACPTWHYNDISAQDFGEYKRLFGEDFDIFLTKDGLKCERGDVEWLKKVYNQFIK
jgi:hypothetical protein